MDIREAKQQVKDTVEAYLARDAQGGLRLPAAEQRPIFLVGAPGIGKTAIMEQVADELGIGLVAYSMTHHTRQSALGLPFIVHKSYRGGAEFDISEYTMSEIIASIYDYMEESGRDEGILFLDEINCVSETLYPSMLQFLQFKTFGRHRIPQGWVVACAGNPPEYNRSVHEFDIVTLDRLRKVEVEPSLDAWREYARERRVHPAITTYLELRPDDFYLVESTPEGKHFVSARAWSELSGLVLLLEELGKQVGPQVISQYVQHPEIARRFADYYELFRKYRSDYQIEAILAGRAPEGIVQRAQAAAFDERLALVALLLDGLGNGMRDVLDERAALERARDAMRRARDGAAFPAELEVAALEAEQRAQGAAARSHAAGDAHVDALAAALLRELGAHAGYNEAADAYRARVAGLQERAAEAAGRLDHAYAFVDGAFGAGGEALVFTTELAARTVTSRFIACFECASYYEHSARLSTDSERDAIFDEIDALGAR